jgi:hypothetical protein
LDNVRLAWRSDVMHPKATYDEAEASEVIASVNAFLIALATGLRPYLDLADSAAGLLGGKCRS